MAGQIPKAFIDELLARLPIQEVVASRITLKKTGGSYKACCPFHNENTPSFIVTPKKNFYHCFGCGANGDAISFLREHDNLSFVEAVEELARIAGLEVPRDEQVKRVYDAKKQLTDTLELCAQKYRQALRQHATRDQAQSYIQKRGLSDEIVERFGIGYAPADKTFLTADVDKKTVSNLVRLKLASQKYETPFDLFQNRLMFPIRDMRGKTVGFGGRTLGDDKAKYINSPESEVFHKSSEIYGMYEASRALRSIERLLVVEGYMDVVSLAQHGIQYAVATLGTATNEENLSQLLKRCKNLVFCFDGDSAGLRAATKAMDNILPMFEDGMQFFFLLLPQGEDPDTLVQKEGADRFEARIKQAAPLSEFFFQVHSEGLNLERPEDRGVLRSRAKEVLDTLKTSSLKSGLWEKLKDLTSHRNRFGGAKADARTQVSKRDVVGTKVIRTRDLAICLGLYFDPSLARDLEPYETVLSEAENALPFIRYILSNQIHTREDLLYRLATDEIGYRDRFFELFSGLDSVATEESSIEELKFIISRLKEQKKREDALRPTKLKSLPSQLTEEERKLAKAVSSGSIESR